MRKQFISLFFLGTLLLPTKSALANCPEFENSFNEYSNRRMVAYNDWQLIEKSYSSCTNVDEEINKKLQILKERRLQTLRNYEKLGIREEGGIALHDHFIKLGQEAKKKPVLPKNDVTPSISIAPSNCQEITLSNEAVNFSNTRNQDGVGWCYAYASSDLLSYKFNQRLSSISFSARNNTLKDQLTGVTRQGGDVREAIEQAHRRLQGFCLETSLKSTDVNFCRFRDISELLSFISSITENHLSSCTESDLKSIFPDINLSMIKNGTSVSEKAYLESLIDEHCRKNKLVKPAPRVRSYIAPFSKPEQIKSAIDRELAKKNPVIWAFDVHKITGEEGTGGHASMIMGKAFNPKTNKCEYLVRNSWGKSCDLERGGEPTRCHEINGRLTGYFYVTEEHLLSNSLGAYYVE